MKNNKMKNIESTESKVCRLRRAINDLMPYEKCNYRNSVIASGIANDKEEKMTEDWLRRVLLMDVEDGFITYDEALILAPKYIKAIEELKKIK